PEQGGDAGGAGPSRRGPRGVRRDPCALRRRPQGTLAGSGGGCPVLRGQDPVGQPQQHPGVAALSQSNSSFGAIEASTAASTTASTPASSSVRTAGRASTCARTSSGGGSGRNSGRAGSGRAGSGRGVASSSAAQSSILVTRGLVTARSSAIRMCPALGNRRRGA